MPKITSITKVEPTFADVRTWYEQNMGLDTIDLNDQEVYKHVYEDGHFPIIFQLTSKGAQNLFKKAKPKSIMDIAALTSIYRPGPLSGGVHNLWLRHEHEPFDWGHPLINETLSDSRGLLVFQEDVMNLAHKVGGFPMEKCDEIRRAIMKRSTSGGQAAKEKANELEDDFVKGAIEKGVPEATARKMYSQILFFAGYGFNLSHATAYAIDSFYCGWLFTHHPDEWLATYLESVSSDEDKALAVSQVKELGYKVMSLDVNYSSSKWVCIKEKKTFVPSFLSCKGVGAAAVAELMSLRPFDSLEHMLYNADGTWRFSKFNKRGFEALVKLRAFESLDCVGEGKLFKSYKGMHEVLMDGKIRHCKKNDPHIGMRTMYELARTVGQCDEWTKKELASFMLEITGAIDTVSLIDKAVFERLDAKGIKPINMCQEGAKDLYYFVCVRSLLKKTKAGKNYVCADTLGIGAKNVKINVWGANQDLVPFALYVAECERNDFGVSTRIHKCKEVTV